MVAESGSIRGKILSVIVERGEVTRPELAKLLAADPSIPTSDARRLETVLHHNHLPKLDRELYLEYDHRTGDVVRWQDPLTIEAELEKHGFDE